MDSGDFSGNGKHERDTVGNLCPDQPASGICIPADTWNRTFGVAYACAIGWSVMLWWRFLTIFGL